MNFFVLHCHFSDQCALHFVREFLLTLKLPSLLAKFCYWLTSGPYFSFLNYVSQHQTRNSALHPIPCDYSLFLLIHIFEFLIFGTFLTCSVLSTRIILRSQILKFPSLFLSLLLWHFFALKLLSSDISLCTASSSLLPSLFLSLCLNKQPYHWMLTPSTLPPYTQFLLISITHPFFHF